MEASTKVTGKWKKQVPQAQSPCKSQVSRGSSIQGKVPVICVYQLNFSTNHSVTLFRAHSISNSSQSAMETAEVLCKLPGWFLKGRDRVAMLLEGKDPCGSLEVRSQSLIAVPDWGQETARFDLSIFSRTCWFCFLFWHTTQKEFALCIIPLCLGPLWIQEGWVARRASSCYPGNQAMLTSAAFMDCLGIQFNLEN